MSEEETRLIQKVEAKQKELVELYRMVWEVLHRIDRSKYDATRLANLDRALDHPDRIASAKAIAVVKAIMGSTSDDVLSMEDFYGVAFDSQMSVGGFISRRVKELDLGYHDFWPFLRANGWVK